MVLIVAFWIILDLDAHEFNMHGPNQLYYINAWWDCLVHPWANKQHMYKYSYFNMAWPCARKWNDFEQLFSSFHLQIASMEP
jgi:hypothetical protein